MGWTNIEELSKLEANLKKMKRISISNDMERLQKKYKLGQIFILESEPGEYQSLRLLQIMGYCTRDDLPQELDNIHKCRRVTKMSEEGYEITTYREYMEPNITPLVLELDCSTGSPNRRIYPIDPFVLKRARKLTKKNMAKHLLSSASSVREVSRDIMTKYKVR